MSFDSSQSPKDPTYNPPNPDPDISKEGTSIQDRLETETDSVLEHADRGWSVWVVTPKWWGLSDSVEKLAGIGLLLLVLVGGATQVLWVGNSSMSNRVLTYVAAIGGTALALWCLNVMMQRRVYGRRQSRADRKRAARERVLKGWQSSRPTSAPPR
jgi:hypothetical protein